MARFSFSSILQGFYHAWQFIFTVILILIWIVAWLVQAGSIDMPEWTKDLRDQDEEDWKVYAAILIVCPCLCLGLCIAVGIVLLRSESRGYRG
ncbi:hypothetical protein NW757_004797 [Fusarium falciforme]|nr:hypothetical protein NW757_004797 [Fusarium falciforme]